MEETSEAPLASSTQIVELKDGDTYDLESSFVEKELNGSLYKMLAYNGSIPGPTLKVKQGSTITINFTNNTDIETTLHSHGVRLDNAFDGVPDVTQEAIQPGETFTYSVRFDDSGVFWYHPHLREDYAQDMGLYGNYIIVADEEDWSPVNREETLMVDDILMQGNELASYSFNEVTHTLMGRFGNTMLVNGSTDYGLTAKKGEVIRFYITNTANTRVFNLSIPGAQMKLVGADNGLYEHDEWADEVLLGPSERAIVEVMFSESGDFSLVHKTPDRTYTLADFQVSDEEISESYATDFNTLKTHQSTIASIDPYRSSFESDIDKFLSIDLDMKGMGGSHSMHGGMMMDDSEMGMMNDGEPIEWEDTMSMMNSTSNTDTLEWQLLDEDTEKTNMDIDDWNFKEGDLVKIQVANPDDTTHPMQHPIHIHGQRFLILSVDGVKSDNLVWKDTVLIPAGSTVELLVEMSNPGDWMIHCHIPEHLESGMMMPFKVSSL
ncbi:multicopper oxidase family protein [Candidatus Peregrinibacteria bacterium]|nr:MAG: multicopper oxidase family protein [Candidatus Peregrinibacteria bacterium]